MGIEVSWGQPGEHLLNFFDRLLVLLCDDSRWNKLKKIADGRVWHSIKSAWSLALEMHLATSWGDTMMTNNDRTPNTSKVARIGLSAGSTSVTWPSDCHSVHDPDQRRLLEKTCTHGEYKYTADDYWTTRIDNHKITLLPLHCQYWYDQRNLTSYCNITWEFYFTKNKNSLAPRWRDKFLPESYACWHLWKPYTYAACFALSFVKLFVTLVRFVSCF